jgi:hypothetical protein
MKLSKIIPEHKKTITINWIKMDFLKMSQNYRKIRSGSKYPADKCYWCKHPFEDDEMIALANLKKGGNKVFCQTCAKKIEETNDQ